MTDTATTEGADGAEAQGQNAVGVDAGAGAAQGQDQAGAGANGAGVDAGVRSADDWRGGIEDTKVREFADRFTTPADMAKSALDLRQKLSKAITVPGEDASDEDRAKFRKAVGVPDSPDGYEVNIPDDLPDNVKAAQQSDQAKARFDEFRKAMHDAGAPKGAAEAALGMLFRFLGEDAQVLAGDNEKVLDTADAAIRKEWGRDYNANNNAAQAAFRQFADDKVKGELSHFIYLGPDESRRGLPANADPGLLGMFAKVGRRMSEDGFQATMSEDQSQTLEQKHADLTSQIHDARNRGDTATAKRLDQERNAISQKLSGSGPLVGAQGRTV